MFIHTYQILAMQTAIYRKTVPKEMWLSYAALGLAGEAGEVANKIKKVLRDDDGVMSEEAKKKIAEEIGDVLWYCAALATELGLTLNSIANDNLDKLAARAEADKLKGSGDNR